MYLALCSNLYFFCFVHQVKEFEEQKTREREEAAEKERKRLAELEAKMAEQAALDRERYIAKTISELVSFGGRLITRAIIIFYFSD